VNLLQTLYALAVRRPFSICRFRSGFIERLESRIAPAAFTVNTALDVVDPNDGVGSLREAIIFANSNAGIDTISFDIPGGGVQRIAVTSELPAITETLVVDGFTQPGAAPNRLMVGNDAVMLIELHGGSAGIGADGLILNAGGSTIRGLVVTGFDGSGIVVQGGPGGNVIEGNFIGTNPTGTAASLNDNDGIDILDSPSNRIGGASPAARNVISGNDNDAIFIDGATTDGTIIQGNYIGTNATGTAAIFNDNDAIFITDGADNTLVGGALPGEGNLISGNNGYAVSVSEFSLPSNGNQILGNFIGTDVTGLLPIPNADGGISIFASSNNVIGGTAAGAGNRIAFNVGSGIDLFGGSGPGNSSGNAITGNTIIGNSSAGITMSGDGVFGTSITANHIGTDTSGETNLGNESHGVIIRNGAHDNQIGGPGGGNEIAFNDGSGIALDSSTRGTFIRGNSIHDNQTLGIDLNDDGITANDTGDADVGANDLINFPVITSAVPDDGGELAVSGTINSTADTTLRIELFIADASTFQGAVPVGFIVVTTDASGAATFELNTAVAISSGFLTATATEENGAGTSEFGAPFHVADAPIDISPNGKSVTFADIDGDRVTIRLNKGELRPENFVFGADGSLQKIDLLHDPRFPGRKTLPLMRKAIRGGQWRGRRRCPRRKTDD
jgi:CSLREA domain-containing protein